ncbi:radical SAM protein [Bacteroides sp. 51]|uniref:radical SAM protein n=1 Tax=Bacteroides sp. 51 TaxID=2302938 RepID=UPI0013D83AB5|nr:radical SAM protein [Bacteroides sp. 51]NDV81537.1 radical SAM protein [Bacteroides sp. 51]
MDKIKRFIDCYVDITNCTLRCQYCYITHHRLFDKKIPKMKYTPRQVRAALANKRMGGVCLINLCAGGETLLLPNLTEYVKELLEEGHYIMIVTNATVTKRIDELAALPTELLKRLFFKFSYHYLELKSRNLFDRFFNNVRKMRDAGCSFTLELTPSDEVIPYMDDLIMLAEENVGAVCHVTVARDERNPKVLPILTELDAKSYKNTWSKLNSSLFDYKLSVFGEQRKEFCYAGDWSMHLELATGMMKQCYRSCFDQNIFEDPSKPIRFLPIGNNCQEHHCYNAHAFLTLGLIPELKSPNYAELRNRICKDGSEWLNSQMKEFMRTRLYESNEEYTVDQKNEINRQMNSLVKKMKLKNGLKKTIRFIIQKK